MSRAQYFSEQLVRLVRLLLWVESERSPNAPYTSGTHNAPSCRERTRMACHASPRPVRITSRTNSPVGPIVPAQVVGTAITSSRICGQNTP